MISLIPEPFFIEEMPGRCDIGDGRIASSEALKGPAGLCAEWLSAALDRPFAPAMHGQAAGTSFVLDREVVYSEQYVLELMPSGAIIRASSVEGAVRAASTLRQLALSEGPVLPCAVIDDHPRFPWRGAMLDTARNFFGVEFIERFLDLMALHKLNRFHWHLSDDQAWRLDLPSMPELAATGSRRLDRRYNVDIRKEGSYSAADIARVLAFAERRAIVVVPEIETPGHVTALLASHPELSCEGKAPGGEAFVSEDRYGVFEDVLCAGKDEVQAFLKKVFDEVCELFPGPWVHAGGDEVPKTRWSACPRCIARMDAENLRDKAGAPDAELLQLWFMNRVADILAQKGKRMVGWDEILGEGLRQDAIVMSWRGKAHGGEAAKRGYDVVMSPNTAACYLDHKHRDLPGEPGQLGVCSVRDSWSFDPMPEGLDEAGSAHILGGQANIWTELMYFEPQVEYMAFPRLCALSEVFWTSPELRGDFAGFCERLEVHGRRLDTLGVNRYRGPLE